MILGSITRGAVPRVGRGKQDKQSGELKEAGYIGNLWGNCSCLAIRKGALKSPRGSLGTIAETLGVQGGWTSSFVWPQV